MATRRARLLIALMALPGVALVEQNMGKILLFVLVAALIYELLVCLIEAWVYCRMLRIRYAPATGFSFLANLASLVLGFIPGASSTYIHRYLVALAVETPVMLLLMRGRIARGESTPKRVALASLAANTLTHGLTLAGILVLSRV